MISRSTDWFVSPNMARDVTSSDLHLPQVLLNLNSKCEYR